jgi:hypothetical protein
MASSAQAGSVLCSVYMIFIIFMAAIVCLCVCIIKQSTSACVCAMNVTLAGGEQRLSWSSWCALETVLSVISAALFVLSAPVPSPTVFSFALPQP